MAVGSFLDSYSPPKSSPNSSRCLARGLESLEIDLPFPSSSDISPSEGGADSAALLEQGLPDCSLLGGAAVVPDAEVVVPAAAPTRVSLPTSRKAGSLQASLKLQPRVSKGRAQQLLLGVDS